MPLYIEGIAGIGKTSVVRDLKGIYGDYGDFIKDYPHFKHKSQNAHQEAFFQFFLAQREHSFLYDRHGLSSFLYNIIWRYPIENTEIMKKDMDALLQYIPLIKRSDDTIVIYTIDCGDEKLMSKLIARLQERDNITDIKWLRKYIIAQDILFRHLADSCGLPLIEITEEDTFAYIKKEICEYFQKECWSWNYLKQSSKKNNCQKL